MGQNRGRGGSILTPDELVLPFGGSYVCANFGENRSRNATVRVLANGQIHRLTDANRFYNLSHAICYSYGTDNIMYVPCHEEVFCCHEISQCGTVQLLLPFMYMSVLIGRGSKAIHCIVHSYTDTAYASMLKVVLKRKILNVV